MLALVLLIGSSLSYIFKTYPQLNDIVNLLDNGQIYRKVDINTATAEELVAVPYIGPSTARQIMEYRQENGPFTDLQQLKSLKGIREKNYERFRPFLKISGRK
ncbi:MAG: hypothetical protein A2Z81_05720 [Omnitrophica WOR_2 bacterium GWA2_45_18]|nr:MAG: hypothetical protein A2Z81_05720 [Omnitrophica WOR_2 bacterium GWA2_45_18]